MQAYKIMHTCISGTKSILDENLIRRIRDDVTVESSRHWRDWTADRAIDFNDSSESESCECCSGSLSRPAWWRIDLRARYPIDKIIFIGRSDGGAFHFFLCTDRKKERKMSSSTANI